MSYTITNLSAYQEWSVTSSITEPVLNGDLVTNQTRTGTGLLSAVTRDGFGLGAVSDVEFIVLTGTFVAGDQLDTAEGGTVFITGTVTATTEDTILVEGEAITDSTATISAAMDISQETIAVSSSTPLVCMDYIKIDNEIMSVEISKSNLLTLKRARMGTTAATHTSASTIYIIDGDGYMQIVDYSIAQSWGNATKSTGKLVFSCHLMIGLASQTARTTFLSNKENVEVTGGVILAGDATYGSWQEHGIGSIGTAAELYAGMTGRGSLIKTTASVFIYLNCVANFYATTIEGGISNFGAMNIKDSIFENGGGVWGGTDNSRVINCKATNSTFLPGSETIEWSGVDLERSYFFFFGSGGSALIENVNQISQQNGNGAFFASGDKKYVNCNMNWEFTGGANYVTNTFYYTLGMVFIDANGSPIGDVKLDVYNTQDDSLWASGTSSAFSGVVEVEVKRAYRPALTSETTTEYGPFEIRVSKEGYRIPPFADIAFDNKQGIFNGVTLERSPYAGEVGLGRENY